MALEDVIGAFATGFYVVTREPEGSYVDGELVPSAAVDELTPSAVDDALDTLTIVGHLLNTGAGPFRLVPGDGSQLAAGATIDLPGGLSILGSYWVIVVDADTVQLAASEADAIALVPIDLTSAGTSTFIISPTRFMIEACVQPLAGRELSADEEADRTSEDKLVLTQTKLFTRKPDLEPDYVEIDGDSYEVTVALFYQHWGGEHYECEASRVEAT